MNWAAGTWVLGAIAEYHQQHVDNSAILTIMHKMANILLLSQYREENVLKKISSTEVQNNFGRVLDDIALNRTRYIVDRRGTAQVVIVGVGDFASLLRDEDERRQLGLVLDRVQFQYEVGQPLDAQELKK